MDSVIGLLLGFMVMLLLVDIAHEWHINATKD